jgi:hypothetical protein
MITGKPEAALKAALERIEGMTLPDLLEALTTSTENQRLARRVALRLEDARTMTSTSGASNGYTGERWRT